MRNSKKITYTAVCTAIAVVCILLSRFLPLKFTPLMVASMCFFIGFRCGLFYGFACIAASVLLTFFWGSLDISMLLIAMLFAPYSLAAFLLKGMTYKNKKQAGIRAIVAVLLLNIALFLTAFVFAPLAGELFFGFDISRLIGILGSKAAALAAMSIVGSVLAVMYDYTFIMASKEIEKRIKF